MQHVMPTYTIQFLLRFDYLIYLLYFLEVANSPAPPLPSML